MHEGLFNLAAAIGVESPTEISQNHVIIKEGGGLRTIGDYKLKLIETGREAERQRDTAS